MIDKDIDTITKEDIDALVSAGRMEDRTIDYKATPPSSSDRDKADFLGDIASFANTFGGDILFGVAEDSGKPASADGIAIADFDALRLQWQNSIMTGIAPRIPAFTIHEVTGFPRGSVIILRVNQSWNAPHMVTFGGRSRFYSRAAGQKREMDVHEIRAAFVGSEALADRIRSFRDARLGKVLAGDTPVPTWQFPATVVHVVPIGSEFAAADLDLRNVRNAWPLTNAADYRGVQAVYNPNVRPNVDGFVVYSASYDERFRKSPSYVQVFRNGAVELVDSQYKIDDRPEPPEATYGNEVEITVTTAVRNAVTFRRAIGRTGPVLLSVALLRFHDIKFVRGHGLGINTRTIDRETVVLPDLLIEDPTSLEAHIRPVLDLIWQSAGFDSSPNFDTTGRWIPPSR
ncbi:MAG TPA: ATP-binding protein [Thermoanaerobaculia bacterium]